MIKAVIDVGSNSVLTTVSQWEGAQWNSVLESTEVTALGEGTKQTGVLSQAAMHRTLAAIKRGWEAALNAGATDILAAATMAARIASNADEFQERGRLQGTPIEILSGELEAELGFRAVANDPIFAGASRITIIDPGGHSTELVTADRTPNGWVTRFRRSYPIGTLALLGEQLIDEVPDVRAQLNACRFIDDTIGLVYLPQQCGEVATLGATGTNLITIREAMPEWDAARVHGQYLDYEEVSKAASWLSAMTVRERESIVGMEPGRERTLHAGAFILERFLHATRALGCRVSVRGWRHALLEEGLPTSLA